MTATWVSLLPAAVAVSLAFATREVITSLLAAVFVGVLFLGLGPQGFPTFVVEALGHPDFIWVATIEVCIGAMVAFFQRSGAVSLFSEQVQRVATSRRSVGGTTWGLGLFIFFSDYFSPLLVGPVMRGLTDRFRISREKLAYICDSTSAPMTVLMPITGWAVYISTLTIGMGDVADKEAAIALFIQAVPFNFYALFTVVTAALLAFGVLPDFGPMAAAERRARVEGKVLRDGAVPMMERELSDIEPDSEGRASIFVNFLVPVGAMVGLNLTTFFLYGKAEVLTSFMLATAYLGVVMWWQGIEDLRGVVRIAVTGVKGVSSAILILALAYCINHVSKELGTATYVATQMESFLSAAWIPALAFLVSGFVSFATGTSWGTYAIMVPLTVPLAFAASGGESSAFVALTLAAVAGGGVFGDHCSPLSDTTVLSSLGCACDHIDHVRTQLPYALAVGLLATTLYVVLGIVLCG